MSNTNSIDCVDFFEPLLSDVVPLTFTFVAFDGWYDHVDLGCDAEVGEVLCGDSTEAFCTFRVCRTCRVVEVGSIEGGLQR